MDKRAIEIWCHKNINKNGNIDILVVQWMRIQKKNLCEPSIITEGRMAIGGTATSVMMSFSGLSDRKSNSQSYAKKNIVRIKIEKKN